MVEARTRCRVEHAAFPTHFAGVANKMARKGISPRAFLPTLTYVVTADWALANDGVQLNHGSYGGCPRAVLASAAGWRARLEAAPMRFMVLDWQAELDRARAALAAFVRAPDDRLVLMPNATNAVATALAAARIEAGDELLTTAHAYRACRNQLNRLAAARGARVIVAALPWQFEPAARHVARGSAGVRPSEPPARRARLDGHLRSRRALRGRDRDPDDRRPRPRVARNTRAQPRARTRAAPPPRRHARRPRRQHRRDGRISDRIAGRRDASLARRSTAARRLRGPSRRLLPRPAAARLGTPLQRAERRERARREASRTRRQTAHLVDRDGLLAARDVDLARAFGLDALRGRVRRLGYQKRRSEHRHHCDGRCRGASELLAALLERVRAVTGLLVVALFPFDRRPRQRLFRAWPELDRLERARADEHLILAPDDRVHALELVDIVEDIVDGRVARVACVARHPIEDVVDAVRQRCVDLRRHRRATPGQLPREQLVEDDAERVDIALRTGRHRIGVELGRHVRDVAHADVDLANDRVIALDDPREAEVADLNVAVGGEQQLLGLQSAVVHALCMAGAQRVQRLQQVLERELDGNLFRDVDQPARRAVRRELGDDVRILDPQVDVVDRQDVRMREVAPRTHDIGEPPHDLVALILAEESEQIADLLERDLAVQRDLTRAIHRAHAARADRGQLLVALLAAIDLAGDRHRRPPAADLDALFLHRHAPGLRDLVARRHRQRPGLRAHRHRAGRHRHRAALPQRLEVADRALGELSQVAAVDDGLAVGRDLE